MGDLLASRRRIAPDDPRERTTAARAGRRHEHLGFVRKQMGKGKRVPRAAAPPECLAAHDREAERDRRERVRHDHLFVGAQDDVACRRECVQAVANLGPAEIESGRELRRRRRPTRPGEIAVDREAKVLRVEGHDRLPCGGFRVSRSSHAAGAGELGAIRRAIPDDLFAQVDRIARRSRRSRSDVYSAALRAYVARHAPDEVTAGLDAVLEQIGPPDADAVTAAAARGIFGATEW